MAYTPIFTGFGTAASISFLSRRVGDSLEVWGKWTNGTTTATQASISLGYNGTEGNVTTDTPGNAVVTCGHVTQNQNLAGGLYVNVADAVGYLQFGMSDASNGPEGIGANGNAIFTGSAIQSLRAVVKIAGWEA